MRGIMALVLAMLSAAGLATPGDAEQARLQRTFGANAKITWHLQPTFLRQLGVKHVDIPATPERIWALIQSASGRSA